MQQLSNDKNNTLACLLIPVRAGRLVLPNVTVAELISYEPPSPIAGAPDWLLGNVEWRGTDIPIVSYEQFSGQKAGLDAGDLRIAVVNAPNGQSGRLRFFGMVAQGIPSLVKLEEAAIKENPNSVMERGQKMAVTLETGHGIIPDLDVIEAALISEL